MDLIEINAFLAPAATTLAVAGEREPGTGDVLGAARGGDRAAFAALVRAHQAAVFGLALRMTGDRRDAEELAQDTFLKLHASLADIEDAAHLRHWLLRTVSHRSIDRLRSRSRQVPCVSADAAFELGGEDGDAEDPLLRSALAKLLGRLPDGARAVLLLRFQEDLDPTDIARALGMPLNTVKSHLRRSLAWLRTQVEEQGS